jgi:hypothetical protein
MSARPVRAFVSCQQNKAVEQVLDTLPTNTEFVVSNNNFNERADEKAQTTYFGAEDKKDRSTLLRIPAFGRKMNATAFPATAIGKSEFHYGQLTRQEGNPFDACAEACASRGYYHTADALRRLHDRMVGITRRSGWETMTVEEYGTLACEKTGLDIYLPAKELMARIATEAEGEEVDLSFFATDRDLGQKLNRAMNVLSGLISCKGAAADVLNVLAAIFGTDADLLEGLRAVLGCEPLTPDQLQRSFFDDLFMDMEHDDLSALKMLLQIWAAAGVEHTLNVHAFAPPSVCERIRDELIGLVKDLPLYCSQEKGVVTIVTGKSTVHFLLREDPDLNNGKKIEQALDIAPLKECLFF